MASKIDAPTSFLPSVSPSGIGGNAADYQEKLWEERSGKERKSRTEDKATGSMER